MAQPISLKTEEYEAFRNQSERISSAGETLKLPNIYNEIQKMQKLDRFQLLEKRCFTHLRNFQNEYLNKTRAKHRDSFRLGIG